MVNSAAHVIYDLHLEGELTQGVPNESFLAVELFESHGHVYSVFAKDYRVILYKDYQQIGSLDYHQNDQVLGDIKPLQIIYDRESHELVMLAEVLNGDRLTTFSIDFKNLVLSERESIPNSFTGILKVDRTK